MQCHRRLPCARPTLDDQDPGQRRADDLVLLALNGADDVAHVARPGLAQRGQERSGAAQDQPVRQEPLATVTELRSTGSGGRRHPGAAFGVDEVFVLEPEHGPAPHGEVAAAGQPLRVETGGPVKGLGDRGTPSTTSGSWSGPETASRPMWKDSPNNGFSVAPSPGSGRRSMRPK